MGLRDLLGNLNSEPADENSLSIAQALGLLAKGGLFIDVRTEAEYERGHIPGSRWVPITALKDDVLTAVWGHDPLAMIDPETPEKTVVVISASPVHASAVAHLLRESGLPNSYPLAGGLLAWVQDGQVLIPGSAKK